MDRLNVSMDVLRRLVKEADDPNSVVLPKGRSTIISSLKSTLSKLRLNGSARLSTRKLPSVRAKIGA